jgi:hypothetical protein
MRHDRGSIVQTIEKLEAVQTMSAIVATLQKTAFDTTQRDIIYRFEFWDEAVSDDRKVRGLAPPLFIFLYLPSGLTQGFVTVTLSYILANRDVSVGAIAGLVSLNLLPLTWKFLIGPVLDMTLSSVRWFVICIAVTAAVFVTLGFAPLNAAGLPLLSVLSLALGAAGSASGSSATAAMALTTPNEHRGSVAGWQQAGALGGVGLGGGGGSLACSPCGWAARGCPDARRRLPSLRLTCAVDARAGERVRDRAQDAGTQHWPERLDAA